jgi:glycosyltransferase involved in cell wall biosynthesis
VSPPGAVERIRQTKRLVKKAGYADVANRLRRRAAIWIEPGGADALPVRREHLVRAAEIASSGWKLPSALPIRSGEPLTVGWVSRPPGEASGGHTTMFRMVSALERAGHRCTLYVDDPHEWSLDQHRRTVAQWWPWVKAEIRDAAAGIQDAHAIFATAWETAYTVLASPARGTRFYFVQDYEPSFYPAGSHALLAEATYRFGFHGVTAGRWLSELLRRDYAMPSDHFDFGCELERYGLDHSSAAAARTGVCYFARPRTPRRAFDLGAAALDLFVARHPDVDVHLFGDPAGRLSFPATDHGMLTPRQLNGLYNRCIAGLVLSATNASLVPHEMLAAGCIPVVNDAEHNRIVLDNAHVTYAPATPFDLAAALVALVERPAFQRDAAAQAASASVQARSWDEAGAAVERIVSAVVRRRGYGRILQRAS